MYLRPLLFLPTGTGRRPCLPRNYTKGKHDFPDVIIAVVPGSLPVCPVERHSTGILWLRVRVILPLYHKVSSTSLGYAVTKMIKEVSVACEKKIACSSSADLTILDTINDGLFILLFFLQYLTKKLYKRSYQKPGRSFSFTCILLNMTKNVKQSR